LLIVCYNRNTMRYLDDYSTRDYAAYLRAGESVPDSEEGVDTLNQGESRIIPITDPSGESGRSVFLEMNSTGYISPVEIVQPGVEFRVQSCEGSGTLFVQQIGVNSVRRVRLRSGREVKLRQGDVYGYVPKSDGGWLVRDDGSEPFKEEMERLIGANDSSMQGGLVKRSIERAHQVRNLS